MRSIAVIGALGALFLVGSGFTLTRPSSTVLALHPSLRLLDRHPFVVRGQQFKAGERVRVVLAVKTELTRRVTASPAGTFTANFGDVRIARCERILVQAVGGRGSVAALKIPLAPACLIEGTTS